MRIFLILGIVFLVVGAFFGFQALQSSGGDLDPAAPILAFTFLLIGIIFTPIGVYMTRLTGNRDKLLRTGIAGTATIQHVGDTGVYINDQPLTHLTLLVNVPGRAPYTVQHREVIPLISLGMLGSGHSLPVAVDPTDPNKVAIDWEGDMRARALGAAALGTGGTAPPAGPGMPSPNVLTSGTSVVTPNTLSGTPGIGIPSSSDPGGAPVGGSGTGFVMPMGMVGMAGGTQSQPIITIGGQTVDLSAIYRQLANAGITITGGMPRMMAGMPNVVDARPGDAEAHLALLKGSGKPGHATIAGAQDMGFAIHGNQLMTLQLNVTPDGGVAYPASVTALVPPAAAGRAVVGGSLPVYVDANNPQNLAVDWNAP